MKQKLFALLMTLAFSSSSLAYNVYYFNPWTLDASLGVAFYPNHLSQDNQSAMGRLSLGRVLWTEPQWQAGVEAGIQSGSSFRLNIPKETVDRLGGVPIESQLKALIDVMVTLKSDALFYAPITTWIKAGTAFRQFQVDSHDINNVQDYAPELQAGFGYRINDQLTVTLGYQYIFGKNPELTFNPDNDTGTLKYIASQQAIMAGFSVSFF